MSYDPNDLIDDPIVFRKSRGALIVSSSIATDPIQLVRQVSHNELEVHLKNGHKYIEEVGEADMYQIILEMMGYSPTELVLSFYCWPVCEEGKLKFLKGDALRYAGEYALRDVFSHTPYMRSKFLDLSISFTEEKKKGYNDIGYSSYNVLATFRFTARVDMHKEIICRFEKIAWSSIVKTLFVGSPDAVHANECYVNSIRKLE